VLLVHDREAKAVVGDALLDQRVGADNQLRVGRRSGSR
jgi:hypothetical protein